MQTLNANNPDGKGPIRDNVDKPTAEDPDPHNPPLKVLDKQNNSQAQGGAVNREDSAAVEAAEGEIKSTPQGP